MMTQGFYQSNACNGFREYLTSSMNDMFSLDLSRCTLIECITKMCEIKSRSHPNIKQNYRMLINKLEDIQDIFDCTIMPAMISSVFWNHFIPLLSEQGLKYSTIDMDNKINGVITRETKRRYQLISSHSARR